ncbi:RagB/SusD family nutrient uptake outer membrane protein [Sphingobacterium arenae]|uniref:RagB/SusD family nutrient uptake outer membrane protein n=1 Tax=Sphingobacterium arenae TaxID=1280598 RepID=A0ABR7XZL1_9SPHI|nr:RagB/SusD family nutrient uptake outer membrane protein [Sphingobacterium arenae]MBD1424466.1 RagB/SusD family nutrient uptake outer membrane protein [Sphingobacterium arenae]
MRSISKTYKSLLWVALSTFICSSCEDYLNREDTSGFITNDQIWENSKAIDAVLVNLYDGGLRLDEFDDWYTDKANHLNPTSLSDEAQGSYQKDPAFSNANTVYTYGDYLFEDKFSDRYVHIRRANEFLLNLQSTDVVDDEAKKAYNAEVRFVRAMEYFGLIKRYGGVPLLKEPQEFNPGDFSALQIPRNTEKECYDFLIEECKEISEFLPDSRPGEVKYRATKGAALALLSRAALYAGSIAKYGTVQIDGLVGIPDDQAIHYFTESYHASKAIFDLNYQLYDVNPDKAQNFYDLFSKAVNGNNGEYIFQKQYSLSGGKAHSWDKMSAPFSYRGGGWGCGMAPTLEMVEEFEYIDGSEGKLVLLEADGVTPKRYDDLFDLFEGKDPRLFGSVYVPGSPLKGTKVEWQRGIVGKDGKRYQAFNQPDKDNTVTVDGKAYTASGKDGGADVGDASKTSFYQRKFFDETQTNMDMNKSETPWVVFRLGEIYLNLAEACVEIGGKEQEALDAVNAIRDRAGIKPLDAISLDKVRHERKVELAFEKHRFWDMKRWRIAHLDVANGGLTNFRGTALYPWYNVSDGKYTFTTGNPPKQLRSFLQRNYYVRLNNTDISTNPKLIQNPDYEN